MSEEIKLLSRNPAHFIRQESFFIFEFNFRSLRRNTHCSFQIGPSLPISTIIFVLWEMGNFGKKKKKLKKTKTELHPISRNVKSHVNPFEVVREYQRALNATKLERVFAKPFVGSLDGHTDGVSIITKNPLKLNRPGIFGLFSRNIIWDGSGLFGLMIPG